MILTALFLPRFCRCLLKGWGFPIPWPACLQFLKRAPSLINPFVGLLAERITLRYFVIIAPTVTAIVMSLLPLSPNYVIMAMLLSHYYAHWRLKRLAGHEKLIPDRSRDFFFRYSSGFTA